MVESKIYNEKNLKISIPLVIKSPEDLSQTNYSILNSIRIKFIIFFFLILYKIRTKSIIFKNNTIELSLSYNVSITNEFECFYPPIESYDRYYYLFHHQQWNSERHFHRAEISSTRDTCNFHSRSNSDYATPNGESLIIG